MGKGEKAPIEECSDENENYEMNMNEMTETTQRSNITRAIPTNEKKLEKVGNRPQPPMLKKNVSRISKSPPDSPKLSKNVSTVSIGKNRLSKPLHEKYKKELIWNYREPNKKDFPNLEAEIYVNEFSLNSLHFCLWGTNNPEEHNYSSEEESGSKKEDEPDHRLNRSLDIHFVDLRLIAECYWSFNKLFREDFHAVLIFVFSGII